MIAEFERYGLPRSRVLTAVLQIAGSVGLLAGFVYGQSGFVAFFITLVGLLPQTNAALAFGTAVVAAIGTPLALQRWRGAAVDPPADEPRP